MNIDPYRREPPVVIDVVTTLSMVGTSRQRFLNYLGAVLMCFMWRSSFAQVTTAFTYQGELTQNGQLAVGSFDFQFELFDSQSAGFVIAGPVESANLALTNGIFITEIDFGTVDFGTQDLWLQISVRDGALNDPSPSTILLPRQHITPAPVALSVVEVGASSVDSLQIVDGAIGATDVNPASIQLRVADSCVAGSWIRSISAAGTVTCEAETGDISAINAGPGLSGGASSGAATLAVDTSQIQTRVSGTCADGEYLRGINADGTVLCEFLPGSPNRLSIVDSSGNAGLDNDIVIGADGLPIISYHDGFNGDLKIAKCSNAACAGGAIISTIDSTGVVGMYTSLAVGVDGLPVISYYDQTNTALKLAHCIDTACFGAPTLTTVDNSAAVGGFTSIAIGDDGFPVISYLDFTNSDLKVAKCGSLDCATGTTLATVDAGGNVGQYTSIAIGIDKMPIISYFDFANWDLRVAKCSTSNCTGAALITTIDVNQGSFSSIAIGADGFPVISYFEGVGASTSNLKVAKCVDIACATAATLTAIDGMSGDDTSIAIGDDGLPVIAYENAVTGSLRVAKCTTPACTGSTTVTVLAGPGIQIRQPALAVDRNGLPVISYIDPTNRLSVAKCGTRFCQ